MTQPAASMHMEEFDAHVGTPLQANIHPEACKPYVLMLWLREAGWQYRRYGVPHPTTCSSHGSIWHIQQRSTARDYRGASSSVSRRHHIYPAWLTSRNVALLPEVRQHLYIHFL
ncbi:hypothetical protein B0G82_6934 [Paraburkholderia sp. BL17N1]|nr:hypothetical protein B0G82_6934 [Paraburkholderia sp. BL17N1]